MRATFCRAIVAQAFQAFIYTYRQIMRLDWMCHAAYVYFFRSDQYFGFTD